MKRIFVSMFLIFCMLTVFSEAFSAGGNIKGEAMYAIPGWDSELEDSRAGSALQGLLYFSYEPSEKIRARGEIGYSYKTGYAHPLGRYETTGLPPAVDQSLIPGADYRQELSIPQLWAQYAFGSGFITVGKLPLGWGSCWFLNPTDKSGAAAGLEALSDDTVAGVPGVRLEWLASEKMSLDAYAFFSDTAATGTVALEDGNPMNLPFGVKGTWFFEAAELSIGAAKEVRAGDGSYRRAYYLIGDTSVFLGDAVLNGEVSLRLPTDGAGTGWTDSPEAGELVSAGAGINYRVEAAQIDVLAEYYYFGTGGDPGEYDASLILTDGELLLGKHYALLRGSRDVGDSLKASATGLVNLLDGGGLGVLELEWAPVMDSVFTCMLLVPWGGEDSEFGGEADLIPGVLTWQVWDSVLFSCSYVLHF